MPEIRQNLPSKASELNDGFTLPITKRNYNRQYAPIYYMRLHQLMSQVLDAATAKWADKNVKYLNKCLDMLVGETVFVVGTLFKEMKYKPSMLEEVTRSHWGAPPGKKPKYVEAEGDCEDGGKRDDSTIQLEDSSGRITLVGPKVQEFMLITGVVCGVLGTAGENGRFTVVDVVWGGFPEQVYRPLSGVSAGEDVDMEGGEEEAQEDTYICLTSGLYVGQKKTDYKHILLAEYLQGLLEDDHETGIKAKSISRLIMAGNNCGLESERPVIDTLSRTVDLDAFKPMARVDEYIAQLLPSIAVDIMAGNDDPGNMSLPQQPLHLSMFPQSRKFKKATFASVTNPHWWDFAQDDGSAPLKVLGTSGQNVSDIYKYLVEGRDDILDIMEHTLAWRHLCPTAPDTLTCYPYGDDDPFIIKETPHLYFCGNQDEFQTSVVKRDGVSVRLVAVPRFDETGEVVLVNMRTLKAEVVKII